MNPARLQTIKEIFQAALDCEPNQLNAFLDETCEGDDGLRGNIEALLASHQQAGNFIETPVAALAVSIVENGQADALVGQTIGHYKISESIGTGGMGEVYLATDVTAGRKAALKLLPTRFAGDAERLKRFRQEARAVVALNHPNIVTVYEIGEDHSTHYIASELIEGETLRQHLMRGPIRLSEAVDIAIQVASALAVAHERGIVHRDIKPENIMLRPDGYVKVLDFGIAKLAESAFAEAMADGPEPMTLAETNLGSILGTIRYMSPEQAVGTEVDKRTDIWSLGVVLYEIVTGHAPFTGDTPKEIMSAILETEPPPLTSYVAPTPAELQQIISKTLSKDGEERYQSAHELLQALKNLRRKFEFEAELEGSAATPSWFGRRIPVRYKLSAVIALVVCALIGAIFLKSAPDARALFQQARILAAHSSSHLEGRRNNPQVIELLEKAVKADPKFAEAHAELALAYTIRLFLYAPGEKELEQKAYFEVERALSLNPNLASAYLARGRLKWTPFHHFPHEDAINDFKRAIALDPSLDEAHHYLGLVLLHIGLLEEARAEFQTAVRLNPSNNGAQFRLGETLFFEGRFREARNVFERIDADFNPALREYQMSVSLLALGQVAQAETRLKNYLENHPEDRGGLLASVEAMIFATGSQQKEAEERIQAAQAKRGFGHFHHTEYNIACAYALMNKTDLAVEWFERAVNDGFNCYPMFKNDPNLDGLRNDARFQRIMETERLKCENYRLKFGAQTPLSGESIAVLPFENLSKGEENAFFASGVQDEILTDLAKVADLKVISRTSVMKYKSDLERNLREIAKTLGVSHVVEGSVQRAGTRIRVSAQLIDARTDTHLWAEHYDRDVADVFAIQSEIAQRIANQLQAKLSPAEKAAIAERPTADRVAYAFYTQAKAIGDVDDWEGWEKSLNRKVELLEKATQRDPNFAFAYCALAKTQCDLVAVTGAQSSGLSRTHLELAKKAADAALRVRPDLGEAHLELARYYFYAGIHTGDYDRARDELVIARRTLPNDSEAIFIAARIDRRQNRWDDALANFRKASELDPHNSEIAVYRWGAYRDMRRYKELEQLFAKDAASGTVQDPWTQLWLAELKLAEGDPVAAQALLEQVPLEFSAIERIWSIRFMAALYLRDYDAANRVIAATPAKFAYVHEGQPPESWADGQVAIARGDKQKALAVFGAARQRLDATWENKVKDEEYFKLAADLDAGLGRKEEAIREARRAVDLKPIAKDSVTGPGLIANLALVYAWTGERDRALEQLKTVAMIPAGPSYGDLKFNPCWDSLRDDKRFDKIVAAARAASK